MVTQQVERITEVKTKSRSFALWRVEGSYSRIVNLSASGFDILPRVNGTSIIHADHITVLSCPLQSRQDQL